MLRTADALVRWPADGAAAHKAHAPKERNLSFDNRVDYGIFWLNYFDALILAAARLAGCKEVYSEDLGAGQDYGGVVVANPFSA